MYSLLYLEVSNFWNDLSVGSNITRKRFQSDGNGLVVMLAMFESCLTRLRYILYFIASSVFFGAVRVELESKHRKHLSRPGNGKSVNDHVIYSKEISLSLLYNVTFLSIQNSA